MTFVAKDQEHTNGTDRENHRPYHAPRLIAYGAIRELTASGSVDRPEGGGTGNSRKRP